MFTHAIARQPGPNFAQGLTTSGLGVPDYALMLHQHAAYVQALQSLGLQVSLLEPLLDYPDAYFVEDVAVVTPEIAVVTRPGAASRRGEADAIQPVLVRLRPIARIQPPGTLDGGDVLMVGRQVFIGLSQRTNRAGAEQLGHILEAHGYAWTGVPVGDGLHLKSGVTYLGDDTLLTSRTFAARTEFADYRKVILEPDEEYACNTLLVNDCLILPQGFPGVREKLATLGRRMIELDVSEARKMDGGLTCMSLRL